MSQFSGGIYLNKHHLKLNYRLETIVLKEILLVLMISKKERIW